MSIAGVPPGHLPATVEAKWYPYHHSLGSTITTSKIGSSGFDSLLTMSFEFVLSATALNRLATSLARAEVPGSNPFFPGVNGSRCQTCK